MKANTSGAWGALIGAPLLLGCSFAATAALLMARGTPLEGIAQTVQRLAAVPGLVGFVAIMLLTGWLARRDGLGLRNLGWGVPTGGDAAVGVGVAALMWTLDSLVFFPLVRRFQPSFDPTAASQPFIPLLLLLTAAVLAEETLYRGYALVQLRGRHGPTLAVVVCTVFYAALTPAGVAVSVWAALFGVVLAGVRLWRKSLWPAAFAHWLVAIGPRAFTELLGRS